MKLKTSTIFFIIVFLLVFSQRISSLELIKNGDFSSKTCLSRNGEYATCQSYNSATYWISKYRTSTQNVYSIQDRTNFAWFPSHVQNVIPLDYYNSVSKNYTRLCLVQSLPQLVIDHYFLKFEIAIRSNRTWLSNQYRFANFVVHISDFNGSNLIYDSNMYYFQQEGAKATTVNILFQIKVLTSNKYLFICSGPETITGNSYYETTTAKALGVALVSVSKLTDDNIPLNVQKGLNVNIVRNNDFRYNSCFNTINIGYGCLQPGLHSYWYCQHLGKQQLNIRFSVQNQTNFKNSNDRYIIPLDTMDYTYNPLKPFRKLCLRQQVGLLIPGDYKLQFNSATRANQTTDIVDLALYTFSVSIRSKDSSIVSFKNTSFSFSDFGSVTRTEYFTVNSRKQIQFLYLCSDAGPNGVFQTQYPSAPGISNVNLINYGCVGSLSVTVPFNTGYFGCFPKSVVNQLSNCHIFKYVEAGNQTLCQAVIGSSQQCINPPKIKLDTGIYACHITSNPTYIDANCEEYKSLGSYVYECSKCKSGYRFSTPSGTKKVCTKEVVDCTIYNTDGTCSKCYGGINPTLIGGIQKCPTVLVLASNGSQIYIPNSTYMSIPRPCYIYKYSTDKSTYECTTTCDYTPTMILTNGNYACPISQSPSYQDPNCLTYTSLGNNDYNCFSCKMPFLKVIPDDGKNKYKCLTEIIDCITYQADNDCKACKNDGVLVTSTNPVSCPYVSIPLSTGMFADVPRSFFIANQNCHIFKNINGVYTCTTQGQQCDFHSKMTLTLTSNSYACPTMSQPGYWDDNCATYTKITNGDYNCASCKGSLILQVPSDSVDGKNKCFTKINDCTIYKLNGKYDTCLNGIKAIEGSVPCPVTTIPLDTGMNVTVTYQVFNALPSCQIYTWDAVNSLYICYTQCLYPPSIKLTYGKIRCLTQASPLYKDSSCDTYQQLGNYNYNCSSCLNSKTLILPASGTYGKCFDLIVDCTSYSDIGDCVTCKSGQPPVLTTNPDSCPATQKPLNDGQFAFIPNSIVNNNLNCHIFKNINGVYSCATQGSECDFHSKMTLTLTSNSYACPTMSQPGYWDDNCATYTKITNGDYNCASCKGSLILQVPSDSVDGKNKCLKTIGDCSSYDSSGNCVTCGGGQSVILSTTPHSCLSTLKHMDTGQYDHVPNLVIQASNNCQFYTKDSVTEKYSCALKCRYKQKMTLTTGQIVCPKTQNPNYWDDNCLTYQRLLNQDYECKSCKTNTILISLKEGGLKKCLTEVVDCIQYHDNNYCLKCINADPLSGSLCPYTVKPLNTGVLANIPNSFLNSDPTCKIFRLKAQSSNKYECANSCISNQIMSLDSGGYVCPDSFNAPYYDQQCKTYIQIGPNSYECSVCNPTFNVKVTSIKNQNYKRCLKNSVTDCTVYSIEGVCSKCLNGAPFNTYFNLCPSLAHQLISNCQAAVFGSQSVGCVVCKLNYVLGPSGCIPQVQFCQTYAVYGQKKCVACVSGYTLMNNVCYKVQGNCEMFDSKTGNCGKCSTGFILKNNECVAPQTPCLENQYRNSFGVCVNGDTKSCGNYDPSNGICRNCKEGYKFDENMNCVKTNPVTCPPDTTEYNYVIELGQCKKIEKNCAYSGNDGCIACKEGFYLSNKQCLKVQPYQGLTSQTQTVEILRQEDYWF